MRSADADGEGMIELESVDLVLFAGQSNMAGRGCAAEAAPCPEEAGWEYRAVSAPDALYPIGEPFGRHENVPGALDDGEKKTGSMVSAFAAAYYRLSGRRLVCVSRPARAARRRRRGRMAWRRTRRRGWRVRWVICAPSGAHRSTRLSCGARGRRTAIMP